MLFPDDIEKKIDFLSVRSLLKQHCSSSLGQEEVDALSFLTDCNAVRHLLGEGQEMANILHDASLAFPYCEICDLRDSLSRIRIEGLFLEEDELMQLRKIADAVTSFITFFHSLPAERFICLHDLKPEGIYDENGVLQPDVPYAEICRAIDEILDKYGTLKDNASPELFNIRKELRYAQSAVERTLNSILRQVRDEGLIDNDVTPTLREGRLVIPLPSASKRKLDGIVHDESATGKTVYVEPQQVVEANNRIRELEGEERRERIKILRQFSAYLRPYLKGMSGAMTYLAKVDFLRAKARFANELGAIAPQLRDTPYINYKEARHPLLFLSFRNQNKQVVPLTVRLQGGDKSEQRILIISGPNAGGKSVCLKTIVLLQYMLQCGLLIPVREDSECGMFDSLFIDIGDDQSIDDDLSTYSSHLRHMKMFVRNADARSLFLIDEFGGGTEPMLGGAIAEAILDALNDNNACGVVTTHYTNLKHFADSHAGVVNGAMLYDRGAMKPLFQLSLGQPGSSFAIEIAEQIGLPLNVIQHARQLIGDDNIKYERNLQEIARDKRYWADKRREVHDKEKQLEALKDRYENEMADILKTRKDIIRKAKEDAADILQQSNRTIENTISQIRKSQADKEATKQARQRVENLKQQLTASSGERAANERVIMSDDGIRVVKNRHHVIDNISHIERNTSRPSSSTRDVAAPRTTASGKKVFNDFSQLRLLTGQPEQPKPKQSAVNVVVNSNVADSIRQRKLSFSQEIDLRGFRAEEALQAVMSYIDDAVMVGVSEVKILHGTGTGVLKQIIRDYLRPLKHVAAVHDGDPDRGGAGMTIVTLR